MKSDGVTQAVGLQWGELDRAVGLQTGGLDRAAIKLSGKTRTAPVQRAWGMICYQN